jgi:GNAT superfamily N-acetyltransferase
MSDDPPRRDIRPFHPDDLEATAALWHRSGLAAYPYLPMFQALTAEHALDIFRDRIAAHCRLWVGTEKGRIVAYMALDGSLIDRLYVDPSAWRQGWGTRLLALAKSLHPTGLELFTHQENHAARALYEREGFVAVAFGLSPAPESVPDVTYHWRPRP